MNYQDRVIGCAVEVLDKLDLKDQIIVGSTREVLNVFEWLLAGAHIVTCTPNLIKGMIVHPFQRNRSNANVFR